MFVSEPMSGEREETGSGSVDVRISFSQAIFDEQRVAHRDSRLPRELRAPTRGSHTLLGSFSDFLDSLKRKSSDSFMPTGYIV